MDHFNAIHALLAALDYDAPVAENGDLTEKYFIIQKAIQHRMPEQSE